MTAQILYLAMVLAAFTAFVGTLGVVYLWSNLEPRRRSAPARSTAPHRPATAIA
jgi:hypothetical protein